MNQDEIAELKRQFFEQASWGFVSRYGRTGRILSVRTDDRTLEIATPRGTLHAKVGAATNIHQTTNDGSKALTFEDLTPGTLVTVDGATGTQENSDAEASPPRERHANAPLHDCHTTVIPPLRQPVT